VTFEREEQNKQVVLAMLEALNKRDFHALEKHPGLYETRLNHPRLQAAFPDLRYTVEQMIVDGDMIAARVSVSGTHKGPFMGVLPTGQEFNWGALLMDRVEGEQIVEHWANADWMTVLRTLQIIPLPSQVEGSKDQDN
jgi:predicted ester cyclase